MPKTSRISVTDKAKSLIEELSAEHGELMFYQAGGCCEGTQPMCFTKGGYYLRRNDVKIGEVCGFDFWVDRDLFEYWKHSHFTLDVADGIATGGFSLETPKQKCFQITYRLITPEELEDLEDIQINS